MLAWRLQNKTPKSVVTGFKMRVDLSANPDVLRNSINYDLVLSLGWVQSFCSVRVD